MFHRDVGAQHWPDRCSVGDIPRANAAPLLYEQIGMMSAGSDAVIAGLKQQGVDLAQAPIDPALPELTLDPANLQK